MDGFVDVADRDIEEQKAVKKKKFAIKQKQQQVRKWEGGKEWMGDISCLFGTSGKRKRLNPTRGQTADRSTSRR